jgi:predicted nucleic acid-binding protein
VWIGFFRGEETAHVTELVRLIEEDAGVALTDVILTEILQGLRTDREASRVEQRLRAFDVLRLRDLDDFTAAAALYRSARSKGFTIRKTIDCLIRPVALYSSRKR